MKWFGFAGAVALAFASAAQANEVVIPGSFAVSESGAANYSIDIDVPPGTAGVEPKLSLSYSSQSGNGLLGMGWSLSGLSAISRCPKTIAQDGVRGAVKFDDDDRLCLDGQRLLATSGSYGGDGTVYRTEQEGFTEIVSQSNWPGQWQFVTDPVLELVWVVEGTGPTSFTTRTKSGLNLSFGSSADSRLFSDITDTATVWMLDKVEDTLGNFMEFEYFVDPANSFYRTSRINYTGNGTDAPFASVRFTYEARTDVPVGFHVGSDIRTPERLKTIETYVGETLVTKYMLGYEYSPHTGRSRLTHFYRCDAVGNCLPPTVFAYPSTTHDRFALSSNIAGQDGSLVGMTPNVADYDGNGLSDISWSYVHPANGANRGARNAWMSQGGGTFTVETNLAGQNTNGMIDYPGDFNGSGRADLLMHVDGASGSGGNVLSRIGTNNWGSNSVWSLSGEKPDFGDFDGDGRLDILQFVSGNVQIKMLSNTYSLAEPGNGFEQHIADFNGDGRSDILWENGTSPTPSSGARLLWLSNGDGTFQIVDNVAAQNGTLVDYTPRLGDFNGDGKADILWESVDAYGRSTATRALWLSKGDGNFQIFNNPGGLNGQAIGYVPFVADFDGDADADILWDWLDINGNSQGNRALWISDGKGSFTQEVNISGAPNGTLVGYRPRLGDFDGDGRTDVLWFSVDVNGFSTGMRAIWSGVGGGAQDLLTSVDDGLGTKVQLAYKPLTDSSVYTKGSGATYPGIDLQMGSYVVSRAEVRDGVGGFIPTEYRYGGLQARADGRGSLGYAWTEAEQVETGFVTRREYRQDYPFTGRVSLERTSAPGVGLNGVLSEKTYAFTCFHPVTLAVCAEAPGGRYFPYATSIVEKGWDLDGSVLPVVTTNNLYDHWGNLTQVNVSTSDGFSKSTVNTYTNDAVNWILGRLTRTVVSDSTPTLTDVRTSAFEYDATTGLITKEIIEPDTPALRVETAYTHDKFGNKITTTTSGQGITSRTASATYDATGRFPVTETNALGHSESRTYDAAFGNRLSLTGPNGLTTTWTYDSLGRNTSETRADGNKTTVARYYCAGVAGGVVACPTHLHAKFMIISTPVDSNGVQNAPFTASYIDERGRVVRELTQSFSQAAGINVDTLYDHFGRAQYTSRPYYVGDVPVWTVGTYDLLDRVVTQTLPDGSSSSWDYSGLDTRVTNDKGQEKRTIVNSQGQTTHVYEASNSLNYMSTFTYDASGNLVQTSDHLGNITTATYNTRGFKTAMTDPDMGSVSYTYNVLGELLTETDAKSQVTSFTYDLLGRTLTRTDPDMVTTWTYDTSPTKGIGKLHTVATDAGYLQTMTYDSLGREAAISTQLEVGVSGLVSRTYDANGRVATVSNPNGLVTKNIYTNLGHLSQIRNNGTNALYWQVNAMDAAGEITSQTHGNGVTTVKSFDSRGWLTDIEATASGSPAPNIQDLTYTFDTIGNMASRQDTNRGLTETFGFDALNRMVSSSVNGGNLKTIAYDALGNITSKSDVGTYTYGGVGQPVHGVTAITGTVNTTYTYDANGNMLTGNNRTITWNASDQPLTIARGGSTISFAYGPGNARIKQVSGTLTTYYFAAGFLELERDSATAEDRWLNYIHGPGGMVALVAETIDAGQVQTDVTRYYHLDHLGSIETITDDAGLFAEGNSYDPWGKRRFEATWADDPLELVTSETNRGFTSHEHLEEVALVHMNGRLYDPQIGRMISADPNVQAPLNPQNYNRYTYALNNPLAYTDPSGFFFKKLFKGLKRLISKNPIVGAVIGIALGLVLGPGGFAILSAWQSAVVAGAVVGGITGGVKGALFGAAAGYLTYGIGHGFEVPFSPGLTGAVERGVLHGIAQGGLAVAQGGDFGPAFLSASFSVIATHSIIGAPTEGTSIERHIGNGAAAAIIGGTASVIGGGKFANGATTGAFIYAFNAAQLPRPRGTHAGFRRINPRPGGPSGPEITFINDVPGGLSTDVTVDERLAKMTEDVAVSTGFNINVNSTTGRGVRVSRGAHPGGRAVDINIINGFKVTDPAAIHLVDTLQKAFIAHPSANQVLGPLYNVTIGPAGGITPFDPSIPRQLAIINGHKDHVHAAVPPR